MSAAADREALRQQMLLRALWRDARPGVVAGWMRDAPERFQRGLAAYHANASALAERALAAAYPVLQLLIGEDSFATMARVFWHKHPPLKGDLAQWGDALPAFVADSESLSDEPYLADVARLEWAVHVAGTAADLSEAPVGLELLAREEPSRLTLQMGAGLALIESPHPIVTIWRAHRRLAAAARSLPAPTPSRPADTPPPADAGAPAEDPDVFAPVREAFASGDGEAALVRRDGLRPDVQLLARADARFTRRLLDGASLGSALAAADGDFDFEAWLVRALRERWFASIETHTHNPSRRTP